MKYESDSKEYALWCDIINDIYIGFDDPIIMIEKIHKLLEMTELIVSQALNPVSIELLLNSMMLSGGNEDSEKLSWLIKELKKLIG